MFQMGSVGAKGIFAVIYALNFSFCYVIASILLHGVHTWLLYDKDVLLGNVSTIFSLLFYIWLVFRTAYSDCVKTASNVTVTAASSLCHVFRWDNFFHRTIRHCFFF